MLSTSYYVINLISDSKTVLHLTSGNEYIIKNEWSIKNQDLALRLVDKVLALILIDDSFECMLQLDFKIKKLSVASLSK